MAHAYTPGLTVSERTRIRKERRLPLAGQVVVAQGDRVVADQVVARTELPGPVTMVNVASELNLHPDEVARAMLKGEGDAVSAGDIIAEARGFFGLFHSVCRSPGDGMLDAVSPVTGQLALRGSPTPVELKAYIDGTVTEIFPEEGIAVETACALVQGIFGFGGEVYGPLKLLADAPDAVLDAADVDESCAAAVLVGGALATLACLRRAIEVRAAAVVVGGIDDRDLDTLLGYPIGVAITGHERIGLTVVLTEGFGPIPMAARTHDLLAARQGRPASVNGATQIRAGVMRPEVIVAEPERPLPEPEPDQGRLAPGRVVRIIREPYFGQLATVADLPAEPAVIETEARVRVVNVTLRDGSEIVVPRANVELIEQ
jgi:hypothetical protein